VLGVLQIISTVVATGLLLFWKPVLYVGGVAFFWSIIFALNVIRERNDPQVRRLYMLASSIVLAALWPGLPVLIWYDYDGDGDAIRSIDTARRRL
jgi:hypothetical protein